MPAGGAAPPGKRGGQRVGACSRTCTAALSRGFCPPPMLLEPEREAFGGKVALRSSPAGSEWRDPDSSEPSRSELSERARGKSWWELPPPLVGDSAQAAVSLGFAPRPAGRGDPKREASVEAWEPLATCFPGRNGPKPSALGGFFGEETRESEA